MFASLIVKILLFGCKVIGYEFEASANFLAINFLKYYMQAHREYKCESKGYRVCEFIIHISE